MMNHEFDGSDIGKIKRSESGNPHVFTEDWMVHGPSRTTISVIGGVMFCLPIT